MDRFKNILVACFFCCTFWHSSAQKVPADTVSTHAWRILTELNAALLRCVQQDPESPDSGAIGCPYCHLCHTRAAEAVYPFAFEYQKTKDKTYRRAAVNLGNWLIRQQKDNGSWFETPETWTGTTTDQTLMLALAYPLLQPYLKQEEKQKWLVAIEKAADYLGQLPPLPSDQTGMTFYPTLNLVTVRSAQWCSTISAYHYKDPAGERSKYMHRPTGGSMCNLWLAGHGFFEASSQTVYRRWEPMSFPDMPDVKPLTPRIEFSNDAGYFTNLYEFDAVLTSVEKDHAFLVTSVGELKNSNQQPGGISYCLQHEIGDKRIVKEIELIYHDAKGPVRIVEPIIFYPGMTFRKTGDKTVLIKMPGRVIELTAGSENVTLELGTDAQEYRFPYPALRAYPVILNVKNDHRYRETVTFTYRILQ